MKQLMYPKLIFILCPKYMSDVFGGSTVTSDLLLKKKHSETQFLGE
jgi:hypothetical protein